MFEARDVGRWLVLASWVGVGSLGALACGSDGSAAGDDRGAALLASETIGIRCMKPALSGQSRCDQGRAHGESSRMGEACGAVA